MKEKRLRELRQQRQEGTEERDRLWRLSNEIDFAEENLSFLTAQIAEPQQYWRLISVDVQSLQNTLSELQITQDPLLFDEASESVEELRRDLRLDLEPFTSTSYLDEEIPVEAVDAQVKRPSIFRRVLRRLGIGKRS
ncbi:hypothetical protein NLJ89_g8827 [Agrocybe chaxingu]|uniref:Uncharacterized protein n=1 Tax=Agrocybe chaxingu TaxID=84603 RepID=A0A9W8MTQ5_9AGAR|nr:hypothetical protein NLJ89_g8827 [Agrocybe chaxingu]